MAASDPGLLWKIPPARNRRGLLAKAPWRWLVVKPSEQR